MWSMEDEVKLTTPSRGGWLWFWCCSSSAGRGYCSFPSRRSYPHPPARYEDLRLRMFIVKELCIMVCVCISSTHCPSQPHCLKGSDPLTLLLSKMTGGAWILFHLAAFLTMASASSTLPWESSQRGDSGMNLRHHTTVSVDLKTLTLQQQQQKGRRQVQTFLLGICEVIYIDPSGSFKKNNQILLNINDIYSRKQSFLCIQI